MNAVPFNRPFAAKDTHNYIQQALDRMHLSGDGAFTRKCHDYLSQLLNVPKVLLTTSCTHALEMAALLLDIQPGDEVIVPSFTFVSTVNAFVLRGARPIFIDIRPDTLNLDEALLESKITDRTRAVVPVHYAGIGCEMEAILATATRFGIAVVEDNAHGLLGKYQGKHLGTFGCLGTLSFHETKNFSCGEGGALLINDTGYAERAEILREKGTNRSRFYRGQVDKYTWVDVGSSYLPSDLLAAYLFAQLEMHQEIQSKRQRIWHKYALDLHTWALEQGVGLPFIPAQCDSAYHNFYLILPSLEHRQALIDYSKSQGVNCVFHYQPLHLSEMGRTFGGRAGSCPITESISDRLVRLPFFNDLTEMDQQRVIDTVRSFRVTQVRSSSVSFSERRAA